MEKPEDLSYVDVDDVTIVKLSWNKETHDTKYILSFYRELKVA